MNAAIRFLAGHVRRTSATPDINRIFDERLTFGERLADRVAAVGGSWTFIIGFSLFLTGWAALNTLVLARHAFDPYPFIFLNLVLSMLAAVQAPVIMMSQNRQAAKDRLEARLDYETNLRTEAEIASLHEKIDLLLETVAAGQQGSDLLATRLAASGEKNVSRGSDGRLQHARAETHSTEAD